MKLLNIAVLGCIMLLLIAAVYCICLVRWSSATENLMRKVPSDAQLSEIFQTKRHIFEQANKLTREDERSGIRFIAEAESPWWLPVPFTHAEYQALLRKIYPTMGILAANGTTSFIFGEGQTVEREHGIEVTRNWRKGIESIPLHSRAERANYFGGLDNIQALPASGGKKKLVDGWYLFVERGYDEL